MLHAHADASSVTPNLQVCAAVGVPPSAMALYGLSGSASGGVTLPLDLGPLGAPGQMLCTDPVIIIGMSVATHPYAAIYSHVLPSARWRPAGPVVEFTGTFQ